MHFYIVIFIAYSSLKKFLKHTLQRAVTNNYLLLLTSRQLWTVCLFFCLPSFKEESNLRKASNLFSQFSLLRFYFFFHLYVTVFFPFISVINSCVNGTFALCFGIWELYWIFPYCLNFKKWTVYKLMHSRLHHVNDEWTNYYLVLLWSFFYKFIICNFPCFFFFVIFKMLLTTNLRFTNYLKQSKVASAG